MDRRGFLGRLSLLPFLLKGAVSKVPLARPVEGRPQFHAAPLIGGAYAPGEAFRIHRSSIYQYVQAASSLRAGDPVWWNGHVVGVALSDVARGNFGLVKVTGGPDAAQD